VNISMTKVSIVGSALAAALFLGGWSGAFVGNVFVLFVAMGIFFGTLNLDRPGRTVARMPAPDRAATESQA
jgi:hypothetical protein